jgi:hypothetical protein
VRADGIDDGYATAGNVDFSGTPRVTVFAALRKLSDAATATVIELSANSGTTAGAFVLSAPSVNGANSYRIAYRGTGSSQVAGTGVFAAAPDTSVLTGIADIGSPFVTLRRNGVQVATSASDPGTGNFSNNPLFLFARSGLLNPFNGNLYALIVAGGSYPLSTIQRVERILSRITPTVNL